MVFFYLYIGVCVRLRLTRVHPFHARSFVKRLADLLQEEQQSCTDLRNSVIYYENIEGGHAGAADNKQTAFMNVLYVEFLRKILF